jgi:predicted MFS family arabinose efflux permease
MKNFISSFRHNNFNPAIWTPNLILLGIAGFVERFGLGLTDGARTNFFVDTLGMSGNQVLWLEGIREIPGLALMFIAALTMLLPLSKRAAAALLLTGIGYAMYAAIHSYSALLVVAVIASLGLHMWMPLQSSLAMNLSGKRQTGQVMGTLNSIGALASIVGMGALTLIARFATSTPLELYYITGGLLILVAALLIARLPNDIGATETKPPRLLIKGKYWLYYVLTFFQGSRKQVLNTFGMLVLVDRYKLEVWHISLLLLTSSLINMIGSPYLGRLIDRWGERLTTSISYAVLVLCCAGFAIINNVGILVFLLLTIKLVVNLEITLSTYVYRIAPPEELTPTLSAGISINHVTSVGMPILAGILLPLIQYEGVFLGTAGLILISIPFTLAMKVNLPAKIHPSPVVTG